MDHLKMELRHWVLSEAKELTNLCNAVDRHYLSDRLPNPYTEKDAEEWLQRYSNRSCQTDMLHCIQGPVD